MDAEETAFAALDALDDFPKLSPELVAWAKEAAAETTVRLSGGLKGEVIQMGREGRVLTLAMKITMKAKMLMLLSAVR